MFNRFAAALHQAVEALAPSQSLLEDFIFHWKAITHYFINNKDEKCPVQESNISSHLDNMLAILEQEECETERNQTGPCMEHLLQHKILETLQTLGKADCPPGMKQLVLSFFTNLLGKIQQPLLPHINVYKPVHRLIKVCGDVRAGPTEKEEIQFLCLVCAKLKETPYLVNFFLEDPKSYGKESKSGLKKKSKPDPSKMEFSLMSSLLSLVQSPDTRIAVKACEGMLLCTSLPEQSSADCIVGNTHFANFLAERLCLLYKALPTSMDPVDVDSVEAKWGLDMSSDADDTNAFQGKRQLISLLSWFDYCDQVVKVAYSTIGDAVSRAIHDKFFLPILEPLLLQTSEVGILTSTSHLCKLVKISESRQLLAILVSFILGNDTSEEQQHDLDQYKLRQRLIERCDHLSDEICIMSLKLFETLLLKANEHVARNLVLRNLESRAYYNRRPLARSAQDSEDSGTDQNGHDGAGGQTVANGPDGSYEPELEFDDDFQIKRPSTPEAGEGEESLGGSGRMTDEEEVQMGIHKLVNCFLILVPEEARSSLTGDTGYDMYLREAHRQFRECTVNCLPYDWPHQVTPLSTCRPNPVFCEGAFLKVLFDKLTRMLDQPYEVNLQVTSVITKITLFPHPHIQEYFLDPFLPAAPGSRTLFTVLSKVVNDLGSRIAVLPDFQKQVMQVRKQLMGLVEDQHSLPYIDLLEGVIVLEEFCKELAAVTFVKHHTVGER